MKLNRNWLAIPTGLAIALTSATVAFANPIQTPLPNPISVTGQSGGTQSSSCGYIASTPNQVVRVTEAFTSLRFKVESGGQPTLMITNSAGRSQCVMADSFSGGTIEIPGIWDQGPYSVFVGDRGGNSHTYTLTITQGN